MFKVTSFDNFGEYDIYANSNIFFTVVYINKAMYMNARLCKANELTTTNESIQFKSETHLQA